MRVSAAGSGRTSRQVLVRPRLLQRIVGNDSAVVTVVQGHAGTGKSVLLDTAAHRSNATGVVRVSSDDELAAHISRISDGADAAPGLLVIDGVADPSGEPVTRAVGLSLSRKTRTRVLIASRDPLAAVTSGMVLDGEVRIISTQDLLFTLDEATSLALKYKSDISSDDVAELHRATEGWPAMLDAALRSGRLSGSFTERELQELFERFVREELLSAVPTDDLAMLTDASAVPRFDTTVLATLLTDRFGPDLDPIAVIDRWAAHGRIIHDVLDSHWRIPQPIRESLLADLEAKHPGRRAELTTAAVRVLVAEGRTTVALPYLVEASLDQVVADVLSEKWISDVVPNGRFSDTGTAVASVNDQVLSTDPSLLLISAVSALGHPADIPTFALRLSQADAVIDRAAFNGPLVTFHSLSMMLGRIRDDIEHAHAHEGSGREFLDAADAGQRHEHANRIAYFTMQTGLNRLAVGRIDEADAALSSALSSAKNNRADWYAANCEAALAYTAFLRGQLEMAQRTAQASCVRARGIGHADAVYTDHAHIAHALVELEYGRTWTVPAILRRAYDTLLADAEPPAARLAVAHSVFGMLTDDPSAAEQALLLCRSSYATNRLPFNRFLAAIARAHARLTQDDPKAALAELEHAEAPAEHEALLALTRARAHLAMDEPLVAQRELAAYDGDESLPLTVRADVQALQTEGALQRGDDAQRPFHRLLALLEFTGARRPILLLPGLCDAVVTGRLSASATSSLANLHVELSVLRRANHEGPPRLTEREAEVLSALAGAETLANIAKAMYVSGNTLKTVARGLYRKLGAADRHQAVGVARALGLQDSRGAT
ncbi:helix-turn-helix transcriptional regulator [Phytoactinopolyspora endophytica]|uniref:helix-turn-helix transcriptional regulator n=1 Tax=Phytoactinopolyspora endophytica TaxID=1642495 RepID=UPI00101CD4ED|nr:LuxR C-terminal-related transcriptional regulator [Phytoactinopolyspora endophytica]